MENQSGPPDQQPVYYQSMLNQTGSQVGQVYLENIAPWLRRNNDNTATNQMVYVQQQQNNQQHACQCAHMQQMMQMPVMANNPIMAQPNMANNQMFTFTQQNSTQHMMPNNQLMTMVPQQNSSTQVMSSDQFMNPVGMPSSNSQVMIQHGPTRQPIPYNHMAVIQQNLRQQMMQNNEAMSIVPQPNQAPLNQTMSMVPPSAANIQAMAMMAQPSYSVQPRHNNPRVPMISQQNATQQVISSDGLMMMMSPQLPMMSGFQNMTQLQPGQNMIYQHMPIMQSNDNNFVNVNQNNPYFQPNSEFRAQTSYQHPLYYNQLEKMNKQENIRANNVKKENVMSTVTKYSNNDDAATVSDKTQKQRRISPNVNKPSKTVKMNPTVPVASHNSGVFQVHPNNHLIRTDHRIPSPVANIKIDFIRPEGEIKQNVEKGDSLLNITVTKRDNTSASPITSSETREFLVNRTTEQKPDTANAKFNFKPENIGYVTTENTPFKQDNNDIVARNSINQSTRILNRRSTVSYPEISVTPPKIEQSDSAAETDQQRKCINENNAESLMRKYDDHIATINKVYREIVSAKEFTDKLSQSPMNTNSSDKVSMPIDPIVSNSSQPIDEHVAAKNEVLEVREPNLFNNEEATEQKKQSTKLEVAKKRNHKRDIIKTKPREISEEVSKLNKAESNQIKPSNNQSRDNDFTEEIIYETESMTVLTAKPSMRNVEVEHKVESNAANTNGTTECRNIASTKEKPKYLSHVIEGYVILESDSIMPVAPPLYMLSLQNMRQKNPRENVKSEQDVKSENVSKNDVTTSNNNPFVGECPEAIKRLDESKLASILCTFGPEWASTAEILAENEIDGQALFLCTPEILLQIGVCAEHTKNICDFTKHLLVSHEDNLG